MKTLVIVTAVAGIIFALLAIGTPGPEPRPGPVTTPTTYGPPSYCPEC